MKTNFKKILNELSYRVSTGIPDLTNEQHLIKLWDILKEHNWSVDARVELLKNLDEMSIVKNKKSGNVYPVKTFRPQTQTIVKKNATKDDIKKAQQGAGEDEFDTSDTPQEEPKESEKNKDLKTDIKFDEENAPESVKEDNDPTDEEFAKDKDIKPQEFDPNEIEVGGKKVKLPVTEESLNGIFGQPPYKFPKKYMNTLTRILNTQKTGEYDPNIKKFTSKAGGGQVSAQASELLTMMSSTLSDKESGELFELLGKTSEAAGGRQILDKSWIEASKAMRDSTLANVKEIHGDDAVVEFGGWDIKEDVEDGIGMSDYANDKGFSTDTYFRVKKSDGSVAISEMSNKKDLDVNLGQPSAADTEDRMLEAGREVKESRRVKNFTKNAEKRSRDRLKSVDESDIEVLDKMDKMNDKQLVKHLSKLPSSIRRLLLQGSPPDYDLKKSGGKQLARQFLQMRNIPLPWDTSNKEFTKKAKELGFPLGTQKGANKSAIFMSYLQYADELNNGVENGKGFEFIHNQVGVIGKEPFPEGSQRDVQNNFVDNMGEEESRPIVLDTIKEKLPLKSLMEGEESMALGSNRLSPDVCQELFGTTDYNKVTQNLKVKTDKDGNRFLTYSVEIDGEKKEVDIAQLKARGKGNGYTSISLEMSMAEDFKHKVHCANKKSKNPPKNYTGDEIKTIKRLENKFGKC